MANVLASELIDEIIKYLDIRDLHTCLFINRQFHAQAIRFIYRTIDLKAGSNPLNSLSEKNKLLKAQENIWENIYRNPSLARHIQFLDINPLWTEECPEIFPTFAERVAFVVCHTQNLRVVDLTSPPNLTDSVLPRLILVLNELEQKPEIILSVVGANIGQNFALAQALTLMNTIAPVTKLEIWLDGLENWAEFVVKFHQLRKISIFPEDDPDVDAPWDFDLLLGGLPLIKMTIWSSMGAIFSFPHTLEALSLYGHDESINSSAWTAICGLRNLRHLQIAHFEILRWGNTVPFQSSNLQSFFANVTVGPEIIITSQMIQPIYQSCRSLTSVKLMLRTSFSTDFLLCLLRNPALSDLKVRCYGASPYTFEDLVEGAKHAPNLKKLRLPWPATVGIRIYDINGSIDWKSPRDRSLDVPERLTFEQSQQLAALLPKMQQIHFDFDDAKEACNAYWTWDEYSSWPSTAPEAMPLDLQNVDIEFWRKSQYTNDLVVSIYAQFFSISMILIIPRQSLSDNWILLSFFLWNKSGDIIASRIILSEI